MIPLTFPKAADQLLGGSESPKYWSRISDAAFESETVEGCGREKIAVSQLLASRIVWTWLPVSLMFNGAPSLGQSLPYSPVRLCSCCLRPRVSRPLAGLPCDLLKEDPWDQKTCVQVLAPTLQSDGHPWANYFFSGLRFAISGMKFPNSP